MTVDPEIIVALIGAMGVFGAAFITGLFHFVGKKVDAVNHQVQPSNGKKLAQYIEDVERTVCAIERQVQEGTEARRHIANQLADHTVEDAVVIATLTAKVDDIQRSVTHVLSNQQAGESK